MAQVTIRETFQVDGVLTNMTSVSIAGTSVSPVSTGVYERTITGLTGGTSYSYTVIYVYAGETYTETKSVDVPADQASASCGSGTITANDILTRVKTETGRTELTAAGIDNYLVSVLVDLSSRHNFLRTYLSGTLAVGDTISLPADFVGVEELRLDDDPPLDPISFNEYLNEAIDGYAIRDKTLYIAEQSADASYVLYYGVLHPSSSSTIYFGTRFLEAIVCGVVAKVYCSKKQYDDAREWMGYYENEILKQINAMPREPRIGKIRSIG